MFVMCYATQSLLCNALRLASTLFLSVRLCSGSRRAPWSHPNCKLSNWGPLKSSMEFVKPWLFLIIYSEG